MEKSTWIAALQAHIAQQRQLAPIPSRESLTEEEEWQCRIIGGDFIAWHQHELPNLLKQRAALRIVEFDPLPLPIFTTSLAGLVAAQEIVPEPRGALAYLLDNEFGEWEKQHPSLEFQWHIHHWSYFCSIDHDLLERAQSAHPEIDAEEFRVHTSGHLWGEQCGRQNEHLWRWTGNDMELLEEGFAHVVF